ncbi:MAG: hypothetical protein AAFQ05_13995 [Pseudomonadota bacterium]
MARVVAALLPQDSLLHACATRPGSYTDCFEAAVPTDGTPDRAFERFVFLFFDSWLFRVERMILRFAGKAPKAGTDPIALARGEVAHFAAWTVDARRAQELLMSVHHTPIRTWLSVAKDGDQMRLRFGTALLAQETSGRVHWGFRATIRAHRLYAKLLLKAAAADWTRGKTIPI